MRSLLIKLSIILFALSTLFTTTGTQAHAEAPETQITLSNNQSIVFFMYSNSKGSYVLDPLAEYENVILIPKKQAIKSSIYNLHHGTKLVATFDGEEKWELEEIMTYSKFEKLQKDIKVLLNKLNSKSTLKANQHIANHLYDTDEGCIYLDDEDFEVFIDAETIAELGASEKDKLLITYNEIYEWEIDKIEILNK